MAIFEINIPKDKITINSTIGRKIKEARGYCDITVEQLAALVNKPVQYIQSFRQLAKNALSCIT